MAVVFDIVHDGTRETAMRIANEIGVPVQWYGPDEHHLTLQSMDPKLVLVVAPMTRVVGYENGAIACQGVN